MSVRLKPSPRPDTDPFAQVRQIAHDAASISDMMDELEHVGVEWGHLSDSKLRDGLKRLDVIDDKIKSFLNSLPR